MSKRLFKSDYIAKHETDITHCYTCQNEPTVLVETYLVDNDQLQSCRVWCQSCFDREYRGFTFQLRQGYFTDRVDESAKEDIYIKVARLEIVREEKQTMSEESTSDQQLITDTTNFMHTLLTAGCTHDFAREQGFQYAINAQVQKHRLELAMMCADGGDYTIDRDNTGYMDIAAQVLVQVVTALGIYSN